MDKTEYTAKLDAMVGDTKVYDKLKSDPTAKFKKKLIALLSKSKDEKKITQQQY